MTGYEIKKRMDTTLTYFWSASYGSIYPALNDLVNRGLAAKREDTQSKRNKRIYAITDSGRDYLKKWLSLPVEKDELRYETLIKLFFGSETGEEQALIHIEAFEKKIAEKLPDLLRSETILRNCLNDDAAHQYYLLTVEFGIKTYQAYLEWCREAKKCLAGGQ